jgi:hypothetical protein
MLSVLKTRKQMKLASMLALVLLLLNTASLAKSDSSIIVLWPQDKPAIKLTFGRFQQIAVIAGQSTFVSDVTVQNLSDKAVQRASFTVYLVDKNGVRIGDGLLEVTDIEPTQQVRVRFQCTSIGTPAGLMLSAKKDMLEPPKPKTVSLKVISVPSGANLKVDGQEAGMTPKMVNLTPGTHNLEFSKVGYAPGSTLVEVTTDELPGGSISF